MAEEKKMPPTIVSIFNLLGGISGLLSISLIVWKGGALFQRVDEHERRLSIVETYGSSHLGEHIKYDDERVKNLSDRVTKIENALLAIPEIQRQTAVIDVKLDAVQGAVTRLEKKP